MLGHFFDTIESLVNLALTFKTERNGNDSYGEYAQFLADTSNDRSCTCTGSATHTCGDECHLGAVAQHLLDRVKAFLSCLTRLCRLVAGSEAFGTELQEYWYWRIVERLVVGIAEHKRHVVYALTIHMVDGIAATAAYTYHLNDSVL